MRPLKVPFKRDYNKYRAKTATYNGQKYHSKREAAYAAELDLRVKAGELRATERQVTVRLDVSGFHICDYVVDFVVTHADGHEEWIEVKGFETPIWKLKKKLFEACYPNRKLVVVK
jgi:hypothetical protein